MRRQLPAILDRQAERVFGDVLHCAKQRDGVEIVEEAEMRDAENLALHLALAVRGHERKARLERLDDVAESMPSGTATAVAAAAGAVGAKSVKPSATSPARVASAFTCALSIERDAAFLEIAAGLSCNVVERRAQARDQRDRRRVGALTLDGVLALLAQIEVVARILGVSIAAQAAR